MQYVNLLPDTFITKEVHRARAPRWLFVALGAVLLMFVYSFTVRLQVATVRQELAVLEKQVEEKQALTETLGQLETELERAVEKRGTVNELLDQPDWAYVLADVAEAARHNAWLAELQFTKVKLRPKPREGETAGENAEKEQEIVEVRFSAEGYAPSNFELANFMARLERSSYFDDIELNYSELSKADAGDPIMRFQIEGKLL